MSVVASYITEVAKSVNTQSESTIRYQQTKNIMFKHPLLFYVPCKEAEATSTPRWRSPSPGPASVWMPVRGSEAARMEAEETL